MTKDARPANSMSPGHSSALRELHAELGEDHHVLERFVGDYLALLDARVQTMCSDQYADHETTTAALLSLESTSAMLGADAVVSAVRALRSAVEHGEWDCCGALVLVVREKAAVLRVELEDEGFRASS